jgi:hypothetical protein
MDVIDKSGYKQVTVDDAIEAATEKKMSRDEVLNALVQFGKITMTELLMYKYEKDLLDVARCNLITDMILDFMKIGEPKKLRGQRGKGKKEAARLVSIRIPEELLKTIDEKAKFMDSDRTAMILSILSKGC